MKDTIILLTNEWPYGKKETFLENEVYKYNTEWEKFYCLPFIFHNGIKRNSNQYEIINNKYHINKVVALTRGILTIDFWQELKQIITENKISKNSILELLRFTMYTMQRHYELKQFIKEGKINLNTSVLYSYWMASDAVALSLLKKEYKNMNFITRCHGFDLYEERHAGNYIPYRNIIIKSADLILPISKNGLDYLKNKYVSRKEVISKIRISRLGTTDHGVGPNNIEHPFRMVSCSNVVPIKRINMIVNVLRRLDIDVEWIHFGDGPLLDDLKIAAKNLPKNIKVDFKGRISNKELMKWYKENHVDIFVNVSASEGIPVSIMEAASFGIPIIATDVGGTREIVTNNKNGFLIENRNVEEELFEDIKKVYLMPCKIKNSFRLNSRKIWQNFGSATINYEKFYKTIWQFYNSKN